MLHEADGNFGHSLAGVTAACIGPSGGDDEFWRDAAGAVTVSFGS